MAEVEIEVRNFDAMGGGCRVVVGGGPVDSAELAQQVENLVHGLESSWSRFLPGSEVSALNRLAGEIVLLSAPTYRLVESAAKAWRVTGGRFNPLMLDQLEALGYRQSWLEATPTQLAVSPTVIDEPPELFPGLNAVRLPLGTRFDPGGIGKGLAVDLAVEHCIDSGATTVSVELGGDVRVYGQPWYGSEWRIPIADPFEPDVDIGVMTPSQGAVTTSSTQRRRWTIGGKTYHHLIDPNTGISSTSDLASVSTCSSLAWWAEVAAKSALLAGTDKGLEVLDHLGSPGLLVRTDGQLLASPQVVPA